MLKKFTPATPPRGAFRGQNFMTPEILAYYHGTVSGRSVYAEISRGRGIENETIYGLTYRYANGERPAEPKCRMSHSLTDLYEELGLQ
jgi:hypothetical protein